MFHFTNIPTSFFFCSGSAEAVSPLNAFDAALLAAGIGNTNLVKISSIVPPGCEETTVPEVFVCEDAVVINEIMQFRSV